MYARTRICRSYIDREHVRPIEKPAINSEIEITASRHSSVVLTLRPRTRVTTWWNLPCLWVKHLTIHECIYLRNSSFHWRSLHGRINHSGGHTNVTYVRRGQPFCRSRSQDFLCSGGALFFPKKLTTFLVVITFKPWNLWFLNVKTAW